MFLWTGSTAECVCGWDGHVDCRDATAGKNLPGTELLTSLVQSLTLRLYGGFKVKKNPPKQDLNFGF